MRLAALLLLLSTTAHAAEVTFTLPTSHEGMKRVFDRYTQSGRGGWRWARMGCGTRDTCWNAETGSGSECHQPLGLQVWTVEGRPDGVSPYFRVLATGTAIGLEGRAVTVTLPPISGPWTFYVRSSSGLWSCASPVAKDTLP